MHLVVFELMKEQRMLKTDHQHCKLLKKQKDLSNDHQWLVTSQKETLGT